MIDLYLILIPVYALLILGALLMLKLATEQIQMLSREDRRRKKQGTQSTLQQKQQKQKGFKDVILYLIGNLTLAELCIGRRSRNKISGLLSVSAVSILCYLIPTKFNFSFVGILISLINMGMECIFHYFQKKDQTFSMNRCYVYLLFTAINVGISVFLIAILYQNYYNSVLSAFALNCLMNLGIDHFVIRPIACLTMSPIFLKSQFLIGFIQKEQQQCKILREEIKTEEQAMILSPNKKKKMNMVLQIQPRQQENKQNNPQTYTKALDILKKVKRERILPPLTTPLKQLETSNEGECSLNSIFNSAKKSISSPIARINLDRMFTDFTTENDKDAKEDNLIKVVSKNKESEADDDKQLSLQHQLSSEPLRIVAQNDLKTSGFPLRIFMNNEELAADPDPDEGDQDSLSMKRRSISIEDSHANGLSLKNTIPLLEIKEDSHCDDIEEIDLNSPQKRKRADLKLNLAEEHQQKIKKKKGKKISADTHKRVLKFTTGQPYLEYLPNMLNKDDRNKKSQQPIMSKRQISELRVSGSVKRHKKRQPLDQNMEPGTIEDI